MDSCNSILYHLHMAKPYTAVLILPEDKGKDKAIPVQTWTCPEGSRRPGPHLCYRLIRPQVHSAAGRIMSMRNSNDMGNRTRVLPACSGVLTAPPRAPLLEDS